jgi:hypothetical protein
MPNEKEWAYQHNAADAHVLQLTNGTELILADLQDIDIALIEEAIARGDPAYIIDSIDWADRFDNRLAKLHESIANSIMALTGAEAWKRLDIPYSFDIRNPYAERWVAEHGAELVTMVSEETKLAIRSVVFEGMQTGYPPRDMAKRIQGMIGLTDRDARAVLRYWLALNEDANNLTAKQVDGMAMDYSKRLLRNRAMNVARTECIGASNRGVEIAWKVAQNEGFLLLESKRVWIAATASARTCQHCKPMDGQKVGLDEKFYSKTLGKHVSGPPLHCSCRCAQGLVTPRSD